MPGKGADRSSYAYYWDGDPTTTGTSDPQTCLASTLTDEPLENGILRGNYTIRDIN